MYVCMYMHMHVNALSKRIHALIHTKTPWRCKLCKPAHNISRRHGGASCVNLLITYLDAMEMQAV